MKRAQSVRRALAPVLALAMLLGGALPLEAQGEAGPARRRTSAPTNVKTDKVGYRFGHVGSEGADAAAAYLPGVMRRGECAAAAEFERTGTIAPQIANALVGVVSRLNTPVLARVAAARHREPDEIAALRRELATKDVSAPELADLYDAHLIPPLSEVVDALSSYPATDPAPTREIASQLAKSYATVLEARRQLVAALRSDARDAIDAQARHNVESLCEIVLVDFVMGHIKVTTPVAAPVASTAIPASPRAFVAAAPPTAKPSAALSAAPVASVAPPAPMAPAAVAARPTPAPVASVAAAPAEPHVAASTASPSPAAPDIMASAAAPASVSSPSAPASVAAASPAPSASASVAAPPSAPPLTAAEIAKLPHHPPFVLPPEDSAPASAAPPSLAVASPSASAAPGSMAVASPAPSAAPASVAVASLASPAAPTPVAVASPAPPSVAIAPPPPPVLAASAAITAPASPPAPASVAVLPTPTVAAAITLEQPAANAPATAVIQPRVIEGASTDPDVAPTAGAARAPIPIAQPAEENQ